jgi:GT2 family glycosyltransferase
MVGCPKVKKNKTTKKLTTCVVIPTYNRNEILVNSIKSVFGLRPAPDEVLVIDQTLEHDAETERFLKDADKKKKIRLIKQQPPNLCAARNRVMRETKRDVIIFIDDDVLLPKDFVVNHLRNYENPKVEAVAGSIEHPHPFAVYNPRRKWPRVLDYKYLPLNHHERVEGIANVMGCNHSVLLKTMKRVGGYDPHFGTYAFRDDTDFAVRVWKTGGYIVFDPKAHLIHLLEPSGGTRVKKGKAPVEWKIAFSRNYFAFRHLFPTWEFWWMTLFQDQRETVLRKYNVYRPWRIPGAFVSYWYSVFRAAKTAFAMNHQASPNVLNPTVLPEKD